MSIPWSQRQIPDAFNLGFGLFSFVKQKQLVYFKVKIYKYIFGKQIKPVYLINTLELYLGRLLFLILLPVAVLNGTEAGSYL